MLLRLRQQLGYNGWAEIARSLPGRTDNAVKRRYRALEGNLDASGPSIQFTNEAAVAAAAAAAAAAANAAAGGGGGGVAGATSQ